MVFFCLFVFMFTSIFSFGVISFYGPRVQDVVVGTEQDRPDPYQDKKSPERTQTDVCTTPTVVPEMCLTTRSRVGTVSVEKGVLKLHTLSFFDRPSTILDFNFVPVLRRPGTFNIHLSSLFFFCSPYTST